MGFTLVELAIVLVIIGLIIGGVLAGRDLITLAERRKVITEWEGVTASVLTFRNKYGNLPGDLPRAGRFFADHNNLAAPQANGQSGNGDGFIWGYMTSFGLGNGVVHGLERCNFWSHLSASGLIKEKFAPCVNGTEIKGQVPAFPLNKNNGYLVTAECREPNCPNESRGGHHYFQTDDYNNSGTRFGTSYHPTNYTSALTPEEAWWLDTKLDDGNARSGTFQLIFNMMPPPDSHPCIDITRSHEYATGMTNRYCHAKSRAAF